MASSYPASLDTLATNKSDATTMATDHAAHHNDLADAVNKIEAELGTTPSDVFSTVRERFDPRYGWTFYQEFLNIPGGTASGSTADPFMFLSSGTGATVQAATVAEQDAPGILQLTTGTTATGATGIRSSVTVIRLGGGRLVFEARVRLSNLSDATERYHARIGLGDSTTGDFVDGAYFEYDEGGTSGAASANWKLVTASNSVRTKTETTTAVAGATWVRLGIDVNAAASSVAFTINGATPSGSPQTTNIPSASGRDLGFVANIIKTVGTTSRSFDADYIYAAQVLTTPR